MVELLLAPRTILPTRNGFPKDTQGFRNSQNDHADRLANVE